MGNGKSDLLLEVERIIWEALFEITMGLRDPELILIELVNSRIPWEALGSPSLPDSERFWFDLSRHNTSMSSTPRFNSMSVPRLIEDAMDVRPDRGTTPAPSTRDSDDAEGSNAADNSQLLGSVNKSQVAMDTSVSFTDDPMDTEQDFDQASENARFDEDAEGEEDSLHANDQDHEETQTEADTPPAPLQNVLAFPSPTVPSRSSDRLKGKTVQTILSNSSQKNVLPSDLHSQQRPSKKRKRDNTSKRDDAPEQTYSPSQEPELPLRGTPGHRLWSAGSKPSMPIDVDALDTLKQRFPLVLEQRVCVFTQ